MRRVLFAMVVTLGPAAMAQDLPVPPIPPEHTLAETAPVPDFDARAPVAAPSDAPSVDVTFYHPTLPDPALGFAPGSQYQINDDRKLLQLPSVGINVPLK
jgi:hypothetical protein